MSLTTSQSRPADNAVRLSGAMIGLCIFAIGVVLLYGVYQRATQLFEAPAPVLPPLTTPVSTPSVTSVPTPTATPTAGTQTRKPVPAATPTPVATDATSATISAISSNLVGFIKQWLLLLLMCIAGSFIASRGIELFFRACAAAHRPTPPAP